jgi:hypothetical protein
MTERVDPTDFQIAVAGVFFGLKASQGYVVAGGAGLLASELINRPTEDLDLFASTPADSITAARDSFIKALDRRGWEYDFVADNPTFCRMVVRDGPQEVLVDLALDSPPTTPPSMTVLGPTLAPLELAGRKLLALFGRAEARDFADVYVLVGRFGKDALLEQAEAIDAGFDRTVLRQMMRTLDRFDDDEVPLPQGEIGEVRTFFSEWAAQLP